MRFDSVNYETKGSTALITFDEPEKLNALSTGIRSGFCKALDQARNDESVRVIVLTGAGEKSFCAGADISGFEFTSTYAKNFIDEVLDILALPEQINKPVIAAVPAILLSPQSAPSFQCQKFSSACYPALPSPASTN